MTQHSSRNCANLPAHVGIIMDGNGRWAQRQGLARTQGHKRGLEVAKTIVKKAADLGIPYITLYAFSTENWKRAAEEVGFLMSLISVHLKAELNFYRQNGIRVRHLGDISGLPADIASEINAVVQETSSYTGTTVSLAINYGGRDEILRAVKKIPIEKIPMLDEAAFSEYFDAPELPPMDLLIRTGGEQRISNFLLWQSAYAELYFSEDLWPDWTETQLEQAVDFYTTRDRRFGTVK